MQTTSVVISTTIIALIALCLAGFVLLDMANKDITRVHAERTALAWAEFIGSHLPRIQEIASGTQINKQEAEFLKTVRKIGHVFRFKLFDAQGRLRLISDHIELDTSAKSYVDQHSERAASVIAEDRPFTIVEDGTNKPDRPRIYAESYVPVKRNGAIVAVAEASVLCGTAICRSGLSRPALGQWRCVSHVFATAARRRSVSVSRQRSCRLTPDGPRVSMLCCLCFICAASRRVISRMRWRPCSARIRQTCRRQCSPG